MPAGVHAPYGLGRPVTNSLIMETNYRNTIAGLWLLSLSLAVVSCNSSLTYNKAIQKNIKRADNPELHDDARFIVEAASFNMLATQMAEEAAKSGYSNSLVTLAKSNLERHKDMRRQLKRVARKSKMVMPGEMSEDHQQLLSQLKSSDRREFDRTYIRIMRDITTKDSEIFSKMATDGQNEEVRSFAARQLGAFKEHQKDFETIENQLLRTY